jgi:hypothetical protein
MQYTVAPLTVRDINWKPLPETVCRMDTASERNMDVFTACLRQRLPVYVSDGINRPLHTEQWFIDFSGKLTGQQ